MPPKGKPYNLPTRVTSNEAILKKTAFGRKFTVLGFDEAHAVRNTGLLHTAMATLRPCATGCIFMTATPLFNSPSVSSPN